MPHSSLRAHEQRLADRFIGLLEEMNVLARAHDKAMHHDNRSAHRDLEGAACRLAAELSYQEGVMDKVLQAGSLTILKALLERADTGAWVEEFARSAVDFRAMAFPESYLPFATAGTDFLAYLWSMGFRHSRTHDSLARRFLTEAGPDLDPVIAEIYDTWNDPVLAAVLKTPSPLRLMASTNGLRHLRHLERLLQDEHVQATSILTFLVRGCLREGDWQSLALLLWIGLDLSRHAKHQSPQIADLFEMSKTAHGRIKLRSLEPDLADLARRPEAEPRFGLTEKEAASQLRMPSGEY